MAEYDIRLEQAANKAEIASEQLHEFVNGPDTGTISTESGPLPTLAKFIGDNQAAVDASITGNIVQTRIYASTELGLSDTVDGDYFSVPSAESDEYVILYHNNAGTADEVKRYPSIAAADAAVTAGIAAAISESNAADSETNSALSEAAAEAARDATFAAAQASGVYMCDTKAAANAAVAGLPDLTIVEVLADESQSGSRTRYRKESGSLVFKIAMEQFLQSGTGAVARTVQGKLKESVSVKDFGAVGDGVTNDAPAVSAAIAAVFASGGNTVFFPDGIYYFAAPVTVVFDTFRSLRLVGTSSPGFTGVRPGGSRITGASGIAALFIFTKTTVTTWGGYSFEVENIDFDGNSLGVGSAILNKVGGAPARPFNVRSCNFRGFQKAICSDISATGLTTGICQVNITGNNFQGNQYALYGKGSSAIMDLRFVGNVCEQNSVGGLYTETGALGGGFDISDNMLEGQPDAINIMTGYVCGSIKRNYFEANTGYLINMLASNSRAHVEIGPNYMLNCTGTKVYVQGATVNAVDNFERAGVVFDAPMSGPTSVISNKGLLKPMAWGSSYSYAFDLRSCQINAGVAPAAIDSGAYIDFTSGHEETPLGLVNYNAVTGAGSLRLTGATLAAGDAIVAVCLARVASGTPDVALYVYDNASASLANSQAINLAGIEPGKWFVLAASVKVAGSSGAGAARVRWLTSGGTLHTTKTYTYKVAAPVDASSPLYLYLPYVSPLLGSATYDPPSLSNGAVATTTVTVTGAALGDFAEASMSVSLGGTRLWAEVTATDTVTVYLRNDTGGNVNVASGTLRVRVLKV